MRHGLPIHIAKHSRRGELAGVAAAPSRNGRPSHREQCGPPGLRICAGLCLYLAPSWPHGTIFTKLDHAPGLAELIPIAQQARRVHAAASCRACSRSLGPNVDCHCPYAVSSFAIGTEQPPRVVAPREPERKATIPGSLPCVTRRKGTSCLRDSSTLTSVFEIKARWLKCPCQETRPTSA